MRQLSLHVSALNDAEYDLYIPSLSDLAVVNDDHDKKPSHDDAFYEHLTVGVREARAWLRGRYCDVPVSDIDTILKFFHPNLGQTDCLTGGQFFAALRLVLHAEDGKIIDKGLAFVQAHPGPSVSRPASPPKKELSQYPPPPPRPKSPPKRQSYQHLPPPPTPVRRPTHHTTLSATVLPDTNPFHYLPPSDSQSSPDIHRPATLSAAAVIPTSQPSNHNPFLARAKSLNAKGDANKTEGRIPPLPPRKPAQLTAPPPRHASLLVSGPSASTSSLRPPPPGIGAPPTSAPIKPSHITSPLMRQSLQASKAAQTMKKAEEQLEQERILQVLKSSSATSVDRTRSVSPPKRSAFDGSASGTSSEEKGLSVPTLPRRRRLSPPPPSVGSFEEVAGATLPPYHAYTRSPYSSPFKSAVTDQDLTTSPFSGSPTHPTTDLPPINSGTLAAPPTHPDRRPSAQLNDSSEPVWPPTPTSPRPVRSKSMHYPSPPPIPPPRRKRPESVQVVPISSVDTSPFASPALHSSRNPALQLSHHLSFGSTNNARDASDTSPMANLQRTLTSLHNKAQPKLDAARYKAEAGLSRRGFVNHSQYGSGRWVEEGEQGLMNDEPRKDEDGIGQDRLYDYEVVVDEGASSDEEPVRRGRAAEDFRNADNLKWPAGDGWKPL